MIRRESLSELLTKPEVAAIDCDLASTYGTMGAAVRAAIRVSRKMGCEDIAVYAVGDRRWRIAVSDADSAIPDEAFECFVAAPTARVA